MNGNNVKFHITYHNIIIIIYNLNPINNSIFYHLWFYKQFILSITKCLLQSTTFTNIALIGFTTRLKHFKLRLVVWWKEYNIFAYPLPPKKKKLAK